MADADIYLGDRHVGHIERTRPGVRISFLPEVDLPRGELATSVPARDFEGAELPNFFLNLLPEGARLDLLLKTARSKEDTLELLLRVGWDTIGDVSVLAPGARPGPPMVQPLPANLQQASFWDMFYAGVEGSPDHAIPGVQEKLSAATIAFGVRSASIPAAILKLNPKAYPRLVQNEEFFLRMAKACQIEVNKAEIVHDRLGEPGLLVSRFDRVKVNGSVQKLHQEDGCQLLDNPPANKYHLRLRDIADRLAAISTSGIVEVERLLRLVAFSYLIGNGDLHAKNISVLWTDVVRLSPGYDLLSTLPYRSIERRMALPLLGKDDNFVPADFAQFGKLYGIPERAVTRMLQTLCQRAEPWLGRMGEIGFDTDTTSRLQAEVARRIGRLRESP